MKVYLICIEIGIGKDLLFIWRATVKEQLSFEMALLEYSLTLVHNSCEFY